MFAKIFILLCLLLDVYVYLILGGRHTLYDTHVCERAHTHNNSRWWKKNLKAMSLPRKGPW
jgi:hypothetical protein